MSIFRNKEQFSFGHSGLKLRVENIIGSRVIKIKNKAKKQQQQTKQKQKRLWHTSSWKEELQNYFKTQGNLPTLGLVGTFN